MEVLFVNDVLYQVEYKDCCTHQEFVYTNCAKEIIGTIQFSWESLPDLNHKDTIKNLISFNSMLANEKGFSLIETLIFMSISLVVAFAMLSTCMTSLASQVNVSNLSEYGNLQDTIRMFIANPKLCPQTIASTNLSSINLNGQVITTNTLLTSGATITQVKLTTISPTANKNEYSATLDLTGKKNPSALGPGILKPVSIPVTVLTDGTSKVIACNLVGNNVNPNASPTPTPSSSPTPSVPNEQYDCYKAGGNWSQRGNSDNYHCVL